MKGEADMARIHEIKSSGVEGEKVQSETRPEIVEGGLSPPVHRACRKKANLQMQQPISVSDQNGATTAIKNCSPED